MNFKIFLSVIALAATSIAALPAAQAQEGGGNARWKFAPNVYKLEQPTGPRQHAFSEPPLQQVRRGATPSAANMLGFNPAQLKKPVVVAQAPAQPQQNVMSQLGVPNFNNLFGKPTGEASKATASALPMTAQMPKAGAIAPTKPAAVRAPIRHIASNNNVAGHLRRPAHSRPTMASAGPIQSYGQGQGYVPGSTAPGVSGGSSSASTAVMGVIKRR